LWTASDKKKTQAELTELRQVLFTIATGLWWAMDISESAAAHNLTPLREK